MPRILTSLENRIAGDPPIIVAYEEIGGSDPNYSFPSSVDPDDAPVLDTKGRKLLDWAHQVGGITTGEGFTRLTIRGAGSEPALVTELRVIVDGRKQNDLGWVNIWQGCGGIQDVRGVTADISSGEPKIEWRVNNRPEEAPVLRVTNTDVEVVELRVIAPSATEEVIRWHVELSYSTADEQGTVPVDKDGEPFSLATIGVDAPKRVYLVDQGRLIPSFGALEPHKDGTVC